MGSAIVSSTKAAGLMSREEWTICSAAYFTIMFYFAGIVH
jgi:hypothetical protein